MEKRIIKKGILPNERPDLIVEWDYEKNESICDPATITAGSGKKVWWKCSKGHGWEASINKRAKQGQGCPYCANKRVLTGFNDLKTHYPDVAEEWHPTKNEELKPDSVTWGSNKKAWWRCSRCGCEWETTINKRTTSGEGCPACGPIIKRIIKGVNDLTTTNPELLDEWNSDMNGSLTPSDVTRGSNKKVWWHCPVCDSNYQRLISERVRGSGCPYCASKLIKKRYNDLATRYPGVALEWHPTKNEGVSPSDVFPRSEKKYWWKCSICGNEFISTPDNRINRIGCPKCGRYQKTSFPEQAALYYLKKVFSDVESRYKELGFELDIYIPSIRTAIEYDGFFYHNDKNLGVPDEDKDLMCLNKGVNLYRIREGGLDPTPSAINIFRTSLSNNGLDKCLKELFSHLSVDIDVSVDRDQADILAQYNLQIINGSLANVNPELAKEWHPSKNGNLTPDKVPAGSGKKAWWLCPNCKGEWQTAIVSRKNGSGCPYCNNQKVLTGFNDLLTLKPEIASEWNYEKNMYPPSEVVSTSNKKVWWRCNECGYEWETTISSRTLNNTGCIKCSAKKRAITNRKNRLEHGTVTFADKNPTLAKEWHPLKNGELRPSDITAGSKMKVWWKCSLCGEEWQQSISNRTRYNVIGCKKCRRREQTRQHRLDSVRYEEKLKQTHPNVILISDYINTKTKISCKCKNCGHIWSAIPYSLLVQTYGCPNCAKENRARKRRKDPNQFKKELYTINPKIEVLDTYKSTNEKLRCRCIICENTWKVTPSHLLRGRGCPECAKTQKASLHKKTNKQFRDEMVRVNNNIEIVGNYVNAKTSIKCKCKTCGYEWEAKPTNMLRGIHCKKCKK